MSLRVGPIFAALSIAFLMTGCGPHAPDQSPPPPPQVTVAHVLQRPVKDWDEFTGRLQAPETVEIRPRVTGYIDKVVFTEGSHVKRGDLLFIIDPRPYKAETDRAAADVKRYRTALDLAHIELARVEKLKESGAVSAEELDERKSTTAQAEANVAGAEAALEAAQLNLGFTRVTSTIDGRVSRAEVTRGNLVTGGINGGTLLTSVVSTNPMYLYFDADEQSYLRYSQKTGSPGSANVKSPTPVQVGLANEEGFPHSGILDFVDNQLNSQTGTIRARAVLKNDDGLYTPGLFARVQLLAGSEYQAILIEDRAVNTDQSQKYVLLLGPKNTVEYRRVKLGRITDGLRVVREGLKLGDVIIVNGAQRVHPGMTVTPQEITMDAQDDTAAASPK